MAIVIVVAHPDDEIIGAGGTIAKYIKQGKEVHVIILSSGEDSTLLVKPEILANKRKQESEKAAKILKHKLIFMNLSDKTFVKDLNKNKKKLKELLTKLQPEKIFTHCLDDPHSAHRATAKLIKKFGFKEVYTFTISNPLRIFNRNRPKLYINISDVIILKRRALHCFKSQWYLGAISWYYYPLSFFKDKLNGLKIRAKYAEVFYKL